MKTTLITALIAALGIAAGSAIAAQIDTLNTPIFRAERPEKAEKPQKPEKVEKPQKPEKVGYADMPMQITRETSEPPRGGDNERPGDRQRRGGRPV